MTIIAVSVVAAHAWLAWTLPLTQRRAEPPRVGSVLEVRRIVQDSRPTAVVDGRVAPPPPAPPPPVQPHAATTKTTATAQPPERSDRTPRSRPARAPDKAHANTPRKAPGPTPPIDAIDIAPPTRASTSSDDTSSALAAEANVEQAPPSADELRALPRYATKLPPSRTQRFRVRSGAHEGEGELRWQRDGDHYETTLHTRGDQLTRIEWVSHGATGEHGTAPERMATRRRGRDTAVAYFQPAMGVVTFSRAVVRQPHTDGAQDRLSWIVQLAAIVDADPARRSVPGEHIDLYVIGPRGDAQVWRFEAHGAQTIDTDTGAVQALKFTRRASRFYDHDIELWLDPARGHWPLRFRWQLRGTRQPPLTWDRVDAP